MCIQRIAEILLLFFMATSIHYEEMPHSRLGSFREITNSTSLHHNLLHLTHDTFYDIRGILL
jgi:hypothetical protein